MATEDDWFEPPQKPSPWFLPPRIAPNLGNPRKKYSLLPKSRVEHVLLHDNKNQANMMEASLSHIRREHTRQARISTLHRRAFLVRQSAKQASLWERGIDDPKILPEVVVETHLPGSKRTSMESSHRRYALALKTGGANKRNAKSAPLPRKPFLQRSQTFHAPSPVPSDAPKSPRSAKLARDIEDSRKERLQNVSPVQSARSGNLPRKPHSRLRHTGSIESFETVRSKTELPLNLTKSFTTYDTRFRREVTIANPRNMRQRASDDPRFKRLRTSLIPSEKPIDSMLQLSPSGRSVVQKYGNSLYDYNELKDLLGHMNETFPRREKEQQVPSQVHVQVPVRRSYAYSMHTDYLPVGEAFVDDESFTYEPSLCDTVSIAGEE